MTDAQSEISNPQSEISNPQSEISNPQSEKVFLDHYKNIIENTRLDPRSLKNQSYLFQLIFNTINEFAQNGINIFIANTIAVLNFFFGKLIAEIKRNPSTEIKHTNQLITEALKDPEVIRKMQSLVGDYTMIIIPLLKAIQNEILINLPEILDVNYELSKKLVKNTLAGAMDALEGFIELLPIVGTIWNAAQVIQSLISSGTEISTKFMKATSRLSSALLKISNVVDGPLVDSINNSRELLNYLDSSKEKIRQKLAQNLEQTSQIVSPQQRGIPSEYRSPNPYNPRGGKKTYKRKNKRNNKKNNKRKSKTRKNNKNRKNKKK